MTVAVLFPGQGSQYAGMADTWAGHPVGKEVLDQVSEALGRDVVEVCNDEAALATTEIVQPAVLACDLAAFRVLVDDGVVFTAAAGHSLGEFAALAAAGVLSIPEAVNAVVERGRAMQAASDATPSTMSALLGMTSEEAAELCEIAGRGDVLVVANENAPGQIVISGTVPAIERAEELARDRGKKAIRLNVAGAFHSELMRPALAQVRASIAQATFSDPDFTVVPNVSGRPTDDGAALRDQLSRHLISPVKWEKSMSAMTAMGIDTFIEAGPGQVLTKLAKRCAKGATAISVGDPDAAAAATAEVRA